MASVESASTSSVGPRYAPDDPTLPKPWKGLIDGSTGLLYYWNPETNVTQYDRPISLNPPLPPGPPPFASTPNLTPISVTGTQTTDVSGAQQQQHGQPVVQQQSSVVQQMPLQNFQQLPYQHTQPVVNQQPEQSYHQFQLPQLQYPQVTYLQGQLAGHTQAQQQQQQGSQVPLQQHQGIQVPYQQQQGSQGSHPQQQQQQVAHVQYLQQQLQGSQVPYQQQQHPPPQLPFLIGQQPGQQQEQQGKQQPEEQQSVVYQLAKEPHSQQIASHQQGQQTGILRIGELGQQEGNQSGFSLPQVQQNGLMPSNHQLSSIATQAQVSDGAKLVQSQQQQQKFSDATSTGWQFGGLSSSGLQFGGATGSPQFGGAAGSQQFMGAPGAQQFSGPFASSQQFTGMSSGGMQPIGQLGVSSVHLQHAGMDTGYRQQQLGSPMIPTQAAQSMARPMGSQMGQEEDRREKPGNAFYSSSRNEGPMMLSQQPKLATLPLVRNPQEMRRGATNLHFVSPGHSCSLNMVPGHVMPNMHNHAPFPSAAPLRPPLGTFDAPEFTNINEANAYREHHDVSAVGDNIPIPFMTFEATGFPPEILREMHLAGFSSPTPIQAQTWPVALQSRDIVAIARTGSGKTLGYLIPAFMHLRQCRNNPQFGPTVLVLAPTRELATQIQDEAIKFGRSSRVSCTCLFGGAPKGPQLKEIERGADIIVATPGRLNDILEMRKISFRQISFLVLDEADRMLDMGFEPQIRKIVNEIPPRRQTLMYTATWPKEVRKIAGDLLVNPVQVTIGSVDELAANRSITQFVEVVHPSDRQRRLEEILRSQERGSKIIIFCSTKKLCDDLARNLGRPFGAASIHGDKSQGERDHALSQFRCGRAPILVATDVAARGLDIKDIRVVINYDFPTGIEDYVHRIGRTGRAGATGVSYTFFSNQDWKHAAELIKVLEGANQQVLPELREMAARGGPPVFSRSHGGTNRWDSGDNAGSGRWDSSGGRGYRDRWDPGSGRGDGGRWDPSGGRGGGMRDSVGGRGFAGRGGGGRKDFHGGRGNARGHGFGVPGGPGGWGRHDRYYNHPEARGRYDGGGRRGYGERSRGRSYSRSPEKVRTWGYDRNRSDSRSWSHSRSRSRSWSRSRSRSPSRSRSRSRSWSYDRYNRVPRSLFTDAPAAVTAAGGSGATSFEAPPSLFTDAPPMIAAADGGNGAPSFEAPDVSGFEDAPLSGRMSPMSPGRANGSFSRNEIPDQN